MAVMVSVGGAAFVGVVNRNRLPHCVASPETPPVELTQADKILPSVLISATGTAQPDGTLIPGAEPLVGLTSCEARVKAAASAPASLGDEPIAVDEVINGARAETAATVVSSFTQINVLAVNDEHGPSAAIRERFGLLLPTPGLPLVAVT